MATRYIEAVADDTAFDNLCLTTPGKACIAYQIDISALCIKSPGGTKTELDIDGLVAAQAIIDAIPDTDQTDGATVWNDSGVLKVSTSA